MHVRENVFIEKTSLMSSSLLLQLCPACLVRLIWMVSEMRGRWPFSCCFVGCCFQDLYNMARSILVQLPSNFFLYTLSQRLFGDHIIELTRPLLGIICILFYRISLTSIWSITYRWPSTALLVAYWCYFQ